MVERSAALHYSYPYTVPCTPALQMHIILVKYSQSDNYYLHFLIENNTAYIRFDI